MAKQQAPPMTAEQFRAEIAEGLLTMPSFRDTVEAQNSFLGFMRVCGPTEKLRRAANDAVFQFECLLIDAMFKARRKTVICATPGVWKSALACNYLLYALTKDKKLRCVITTQKMNQSTKQVNALRKLLTSSNFRWIFPECKVDHIKENAEYRRATGEKGTPRADSPWNQERFYVKRDEHDPDASVEAVPFLGRSLNQRIDILVADDIETNMTVGSLEARNSTEEVLFSKWISRLTDPYSKGMMFLLSNCHHEDDIVHRLQVNAAFTSVHIFIADDRSAFEVRLFNDAGGVVDGILQNLTGAYKGRNGLWRLPFPVDSEEYNLVSLTEKEATELDFECKWLGIPITDKHRMFPSWTTRRIHPGTVAGMLPEVIDRGGLPEFPPHVAQRYSFAWGYDMAGGKKNGEMMQCISIDSQGVFRPVEIHYSENFTIEQIIEIIESARCRGIYPCTFRPEDNAVQKKIVNELKITTIKRAIGWSSIIEAHHTGSDKMDAKHGLPSVELAIKEGKYEWPRGMEELPGEIGETWRTAASQMFMCPRMPKRNETPEAPMTTWFCIKGLRERGFIRTAASSQSRGFVSLGQCREVSIV